MWNKDGMKESNKVRKRMVKQEGSDKGRNMRKKNRSKESNSLGIYKEKEERKINK